MFRQGWPFRLLTTPRVVRRPRAQRPRFHPDRQLPRSEAIACPAFSVAFHSRVVSPTCRFQSFGPSTLVSGSAYLLLRLSAWSASLALPTAWSNTPSADFCVPVRAPYESLSSKFRTRRRSPGVSSVAFRAQLPNLRFAPLMDLDFAISSPLVRRLRLISGFCSSTRTFAPRFLQTPPRGGSPCASLTLRLHQAG